MHPPTSRTLTTSPSTRTATYIAEDTVTPPGMDIWVAVPSGQHSVRFASLTDCTGEPSGIYFDKTGIVLFANVLHRAGRISA